MKKNNYKKIGIYFSISAFLMLIGSITGFDIAMAAENANDIAGISRNVVGNVPSILNVISVVSYLIGIGLGLKGALKLKEYNETHGQQVKLSTPITLLIVASLCLALPTVVTASKNAVFGNDSSGVVDYQGGGLLNVGK